MNNNIPQFSKITPLIKRNVAWSSPEAIRWQTEVASKTSLKNAIALCRQMLFQLLIFASNIPL